MNLFAPDRIWVLRGGALGDGIVTLPALAALRTHWPTAHITLCAYPHLARLALAGGWVDEVHSLDSAAAAALFHGSARLAPAWSQALRAVELAINFLHDPSGVVTARLREAGVRHVKAIDPRPAAGPVADALAAPLRDLGVRVVMPCIPQLRVPGIQRETPGGSRPPGRRLVTLHPGSGSPQKNWPASKFAGLARRLAREPDIQLMLLIGEADEACLREWDREPPIPDIPIVREPDLIQVAKVLAGACVHVGNDSGITHLAAAVATPVVALFGPSDPGMWAPRGLAPVRLIQSGSPGPEGLATVSEERVFAAVHSLLRGGQT